MKMFERRKLNEVSVDPSHKFFWAMQEHSLNNNRLYWWMEFSKQMADLKQTILKGKGRRQGEGKVRLITSEV